MKNLQPATAVKVFRNNGEKAPITVQFVQVKENESSNAHSRMISRGLGRSNNTTQYLLVNYTEAIFDEDFADFGFTADQVELGYANSLDLNISVTDLVGEPMYISRIETTNTDIVLDTDGNVKLGWSVKTVNGQELTHEGKLIYSKNEFTYDGVDHKLKHDQDLSMRNTSNSDIKPKAETKVNTKVNTKVDAKVDAELDAISETQPTEVEEKEDVSFEF